MKKTIRKISAALSAAVIFASCLTPAAFADPAKTEILHADAETDLSDYTGWVESENFLRFYYINGVMQTEPMLIDGVWCIFGMTGVLNEMRPFRADAEIDLNNYWGWVQPYKGDRSYYYEKGVLKEQTETKVIDGVRYLFQNGRSKGTYSGWIGSSKGRRYWDGGILQKNKWLRCANGDYYYVDEKGYMTVGWSDVTRIGGAYSYFDENGVWDGKVYWSKSNPDATRENMLTETVRIKIKPIETIFGSDIKWSKAKREYLESNSFYELEIPLTVADTLSVGDTILVNPAVERGEKKNGVYDYHLIIAGWQPLVYIGGGVYPYYMIADSNKSGVLDEDEYFDAFEDRLELFNSFLLIQDGKLKLDRMFQVLGLSWEEIRGNEQFIRYFKDIHDGIYCWDGVTTYGLFGGYNRIDDETGEYVYHDGMSEEELLDLMKRLSAESKAEREADEQEEGDYDYYDWFMRASSPGFWLKAEIAEIPAV